MDERAKRILGSLKRKYVLIPVAGMALAVFILSGVHEKIGNTITNKVVLYLIGGENEPAKIEVVQGAEASEESQGELNPGKSIDQPGEETKPEIDSGEEYKMEKDQVEERASTPEHDKVMIAKAGDEKQDFEHQIEVRPDTPAVASSLVDPNPQPEQAPARTLEQVHAYTATYLRDPFYSLVKAEKQQPSKLLDVSKAKMVGAVWGESGIIALLEDEKGRSYALREGDRVLNGRVSKVTPTSVTFVLTIFGMTRQVTLEIAEEGEW